MSYSVTDNNVEAYLKQIKSFIYTFNDKKEVGTYNLYIVLKNIQKDIKEFKYQTNDSLTFCYSRLNRLDLLIAESENKTKNNDNIDYRYTGYKEHTRAATVFSGFMELTNLIIDSCLASEVATHAQLEREKRELSLLIKNLETQLDLIDEFIPQLSQLITLCST